MPAHAPQPLTVSELARQLKDVLNGTFPDVLLRGEIANFTAHRSGHWYFSLKDPGATLNCVMFRGHNQRVGFRPKVGDEVVLTGQLDVYAPAGRVNLVARRMQKAGEGDAQAKLEALKQKLQAEGLFAEERKRPLPSVPRAIGVVTSGSGAAFHDIDKVLARRFPSVPVFLASCRVQGPGAAESIVAALELLWEHGGSDVIIVGRGGGSREDLAAFDDERLARAIAASPVPVVSAVGHEVDVSIADLVADARAATPSHAAELVVPEADALAAWVDEQLLRLQRRLRDDLAARRRHLRGLRLRDPRQRLADARIRCDELSDRLLRASQRDLQRRRERLGSATGHLDALSPLRVLERGYAVALHEGRAVRDADSLAEGDRLELRLHRGAAAVRVESVRRDALGGESLGPAPADATE